MRQQAAITVLLEQMADGDAAALDALVPLVYTELRDLAQRLLAREYGQRTLSATALVHEAYAQLAKPGANRGPDWQDRQHFFAVASVVMRRILVEAARKRLSQKRGGDAIVVSIDEAPELSAPEQDARLLAVDAAVERLAARNARAARVVECRYFAGMTMDETATVLRVSPVTVKRDWSAARAWLARELAG